MTDFNTPGAGTWTATFTGSARVYCWGAGGAGEGGLGLSRGGGGGGGGALAYKDTPVVTGTVYSFFVGTGGVGGTTSPNAPGTAGTDTTFGSTVIVRGAGGAGGASGVGGAGGTEAASLGDATFPGGNGAPYPSGSFDGAPGGKGGGSEGGAGGVGGVNGTGATNGTAPGGGGGGASQYNSALSGGNGANGRVRIIAAPVTVTGYHVDAASTPGTSSWSAPGDGTVIGECYGAGAGARGGALFGYGAAGAGGGAYSYKAIPVRKGAVYTRVVGAHGSGSAFNTATATNGTDSSLSLAAVVPTTKAIVANVATLGFGAVVHGFFVGDSITVTGVDATFNGTFTVTAVPDSFHVSYAKVAANTSAAATGSVSLATPTLILAKAGTASTGTNVAGGQGVGGDAAAGIGSTKNSGSSGILAIAGTNDGGNGGRGALPNGGAGGLGGLYSNSTNGQPGVFPGGGGGGGTNQASFGAGAAGADGEVLISYYLTFGSVIEGGREKFIVAITYKDSGGAVHSITTASRIYAGARVSLLKCRPDLTAGVRLPPTYIPAGNTPSTAPRNPSVAYSSIFDVHRGTLNYATPHLDAAIAAGNAEIVIVGDSIAEGWTHLDSTLPYAHTADFPNAWPRIMRNQIALATGFAIGGTGLIRPSSVAGSFDPEWAQGGWDASGIHYIFSSDNTKTAIFSPDYSGTAVAVMMAGVGQATVKIDGVVVGNTTGGGSAVSATRTVFTGLANTKHVVSITPAVGTPQCVGVDVYTPASGIRVHNLSQGGSTASGTGQGAWVDASSGSPANMLPLYDQIIALLGRAPDAVIIGLGGNDIHGGASAATISAAHDTIGSAFINSATDIILLPDAHGSNLFLSDAYNLTKPMWTALMTLAVTKGWSYIDFDWLTGGYDGLAGHTPPYTGDDFGHLNVDGAKYFGALMSRVVLNT